MTGAEDGARPSRAPRGGGAADGANGKVGGDAASDPSTVPAPAAGPAPGRRGGQYRASRSTGYRAHSHYTPDELEDRAKNAWYWTQLEDGGFNTKSELVVAAMTLMCEMLEDRFNDGQVFPPAPEQVRRGPSPAGAARQSAAMRDYWDRRRDGQNPRSAAEAGEVGRAAGTERKNSPSAAARGVDGESPGETLPLTWPSS